jgi:hypothetical protein
MRCALLLAAFALASPAVAQEAARTGEELATLGLDELIERLPPVGEEWAKGTGSRTLPLVPVAAEFRARIEGGAELTAEQWMRALTRSGALRLRERWPASEPFAVSMTAPGWLRWSSVTVDPRDSGLASARAGSTAGRFDCGFYGARVVEGWRHQELGRLAPGTRSLPIELVLRRGKASPAPPGTKTGVFFRGAGSLEVDVVATVDEVVPPRASAELDGAVRESLSVSFGSSEGERHVGVLLTPALRLARLAGLGISLDVELLENGEPREVVQLVAEATDPRDYTAHRGLSALPIALEQESAGRAAWSVRVTGTSRDVLRLWNAEARWSGSFEVPLEELVERGTMWSR